MKTIKKNRENNRNQFGSKFDERTNVSLVFFAVDWSWLCFFDQNLKQKQKAYSIFFSNKLIWFFLWLVPWILFFFVFLVNKKQIVGDANQL